MRHWQGPALVCYNDSEFSPADFHNISRIGQDSKLEKPGATGELQSLMASAGCPDRARTERPWLANEPEQMPFHCL